MASTMEELLLTRLVESQREFHQFKDQSQREFLQFKDQANDRLHQFKDQSQREFHQFKDQANDRLLQFKDQTTDRIVKLELEKSKLSHELKLTTAQLLYQRGKLEPRGLLEYCEDKRMPRMGIQFNKFKRYNGWAEVWAHSDFEEHRNKTLESQRLANAKDKASEFGHIVWELFQGRNKVIHDLDHQNIVIPKNFSRDEKICLEAICKFAQIYYIYEDSGYGNGGDNNSEAQAIGQSGEDDNGSEDTEHPN